jgi:hypothetical protein
MPKISNLPNATTIHAADYIVVVDNSAVPETKKAQASLVGLLAPVQTVAGKDGNVTLEAADVSGLNALLDKTVYSDTTGISNAAQVLNVVALTQADYDAISSPQAGTLYVILDA